MNRLLIIFCLAALCGLTTAQSSQPDERYRIALSIYGVSIEGSQERTLRITGKSKPEQEAILNEPPSQLQAGQTFQLVVAVTMPDGQVVNFTGHKRLRYESFGCLSVTGAGVVTVASSATCKGADFPELWIAFTDATEERVPIAMNQYVFRVVP